VWVILVGFVVLAGLVTAVFLSEKNNIKRQAAQLEKSINLSQMNLDAYAQQIGELQARIMRLDAQNKRLMVL
jgi:septal ring factor EnvC (AmiA/AmiB activator)